jgi:hypothetical protein
MHATLPAKKPSAWTDEQLLALPDDGYKYELLDGILTGAPVLAGFKCKLRRLFSPR